MKRKSDPPQVSKMKRRCRTSEREQLDPQARECSAKTDLSYSDKQSHKRHLSSLHNESSFLKFLNEDRQKPTSLCDLTVSVSGKQFSAHKVVLAFGSSYFHTRLCKNPETSHITVDHMDDSAFQHLLCFLYTSEFVVSDTEIPCLVDAARFLNMLTAVELLTDQCGSTTTTESPVQREAGSVHNDLAEAAGPQSPPAGGAKAQGPGAVSCLLCSRTFCYRKSLEKHMARSHTAESQSVQGEVAIETVAVVTTRRSARQRKTPAKFDSLTTEGKANEQILNGKGEEVDRGGGQDDEDAEGENEEDTEQDTEEGAQRLEVVKGQNPTEAQEKLMIADHVEMVIVGHQEEQTAESRQVVGSNSTTTSQVEADAASGIPPSHEVVAHSRASGSSTHTYPEGLAPLVIHTSNRKTLQCPKCDKTFDRIGKYESHTRVHTGEKPFQCDICHQCYSTKSNLTVHKKKHANNAPFQKKDHKCPFCNKLHASKKTMAKHVRRFHPDHIQEFMTMRKKKSEGWKCDICHKSFTRRPHLEEHMILHSQDRPFKCAYCDDYFKSRFARLKHQEKYHLGPFPCDICGRQFNDTGNRKRHIECTHGGKRKWTCYLCGKSVRERTTLREHLRIHSGEKPHLCSICGQSFRHGSSYRLHLRVHHDDKRYECDECGKTFIRHDHLTKHKKIHSGEKAHQCEECGKCFRRHDHLTVHYKSVHLGEKVWQKYKTAVHQCEVCKKEFKGKSSLEMHFRTHSGEKPYRCPICQQTFRIKKTLTKHMVIHSDARPFNCPHCSATFKRKDKLKYHVDHVHSSRPAEQPQAGLPGEKIMPPLPYSEPTKLYRAEHKSVLQSVSSGDVCVPVTLVPVQMSEISGQAGLPVQGAPHGVLPQGQPATAGYQPATDLVFLEKYTLTPQPTNIVHPVRPDQMMDPREQSYLGTLLGLDSATPVQTMPTPDHSH
ncbi:zinc finger and BTB domain-containing protein 41 [Alosa sapidissima]|uniref:zinc finger and BTB domain-containing protein 41 n=1 Tax=Alosa sapidissima TaxID=34773 RepID=UPI001C096E69|nr:zinc finger and BTB domain-containing protein 41 [Alosa sapidissima]XP_041967443.1 zinc finger and BTB domain-containing protein 41 [Alosa sapidissima]